MVRPCIRVRMATHRNFLRDFGSIAPHTQQVRRYTSEGSGSDRWPRRPVSSANDPTRCSISHDSTPPSVTRWTRSFKTPPCAACHGHYRQIFGHHQLVPQLMAHMTVPVPAHPHQLPTRACDLFQGLLPPHRFRQQSAAQRLEFVLAERCGAR